MNIKTKDQIFLTFLESLKHNDIALIESIKQGFNVICENSSGSAFKGTYDSSDDSYTIVSENPEFIVGLIKKSPTLQQAIQQNNIAVEQITGIDVGAIIDNAEGVGYTGGSRGSWDEPSYGSSFEDGIEVDLSGMVAHIYIADNDIEIEIPDTDTEIYSILTEIASEDDSLYEKLLNDYEEDREYDRADYEADAREARWERDLDRY